MAKRKTERERRVRVEGDNTYVWCHGWDGCGWILAKNESDVLRLLAQKPVPQGFGR